MTSDTLKNLKVLYCYSLKKNDGGNVHVQEFIHAFESLGNQIDVAFQNTISLEKPGQSMGLLKKVFTKLIWLFGNIQFFIKIFYKYLIKKPDVIIFRHTNNHVALLSQVLMKYLAPLVLEVNGISEMERNENTSSKRIIFDRFVLKIPKNIFVVSTQLKQYLVSHNYADDNKITVIENGVDITRFNPNISGESIRKRYGLEKSIVIGFVGTFKAWHGVYKILELAQEFREHSYKFVLVGDGECRASCEEYVNQNHLNNTVIFTGLVPHNSIPEYIAAMDILLAPFPRNYYESQKGFFGSALKIFEYMAMAKPVIAPPMGQIAEVISDKKSGRLIFSEDTIELKAELQKMCNDPDYRNYIGKNARQHVESHYTWKSNAEKVRQLCVESIVKP
ncbi:hypothetical protein A1359_11700 [Methylomonas lenta]|uniref:Glycosyltransferase subfamily 4-like N-terminal domain-containing protein n=1 Tax=Methylomonas lenta TaxID=980561 RepID=A0A177N7C7_9GAMM|nr:glycosyltransferase family 4 protein [Methylomonas lenta]OAI13771.1 hypothetical protein A1359_11700 [Methylomonas lenta]